MFGKSLRTTLVLVILLGLVSACGGEDATSTPVPAAEEQPQPTDAPPRSRSSLIATAMPITSRSR
jgi:curli biogenesis system outer membrane secretion channel CsgG